jgi:type I restriction enzyme R subunit
MRRKDYSEARLIEAPSIALFSAMGFQTVDAYEERQLSDEEKRAVSENLTEEELALFDVLTKPDPVLTKAEEAVVKRVAKGLLEKLKAEKLVYEWRKRQQSRAAVRLWIEHALEALPRSYTPEIFEKKCERTYEHVFNSYFGEGGGIYAQAS